MFNKKDDGLPPAKPTPKPQPQQPVEKPVEKPPESLIKLPHMEKAQADIGKKETDSAYNKKMVPFWKKSGVAIGTLVGSAAAWCGLFVFVQLNTSGLSTAPGGYRAKAWDNYGTKIEWRTDGIPRGSVVRINSASDCKSSKGNHVTFANGDCTAKELNAKGATFDGLGGNQGNMVKVSTYEVSKICYVGFPPELPKPGPVTVSKNCSSKKSSNESTR